MANLEDPRDIVLWLFVLALGMALTSLMCLLSRHWSRAAALRRRLELDQQEQIEQRRLRHLSLFQRMQENRRVARSLLAATFGVPASVSPMQQYSAREMSSWCPSRTFEEISNTCPQDNHVPVDTQKSQTSPVPLGKKSSEDVELTSIEIHDGANESNASCSICFEPFDKDTLVRQLPCNHVYHCECIDTWFRRSSSCPLCMRDFSSNVGEIYGEDDHNEQMNNTDLLEDDPLAVALIAILSGAVYSERHTS